MLFTWLAFTRNAYHHRINIITQPDASSQHYLTRHISIDSFLVKYDVKRLYCTRKLKHFYRQLVPIFTNISSITLQYHMPLFNTFYTVHDKNHDDEFHSAMVYTDSIYTCRRISYGSFYELVISLGFQISYTEMVIVYAYSNCIFNVVSALVSGDPRCT